ncbi:MULTISPECIES: DUF7344 domain-containing protein [Halolamina]|uniref:DUF7344 domain-containing protein n=1 Tax=Halolamina pelagica TaxID=699431 RepID=A0A1I5TCH2_9EURY|nr:MULTISPECIES: hypothetical protein [Halolamina]NHX37273.1 hypothetical protein [Halolamina sp. R1-12]SFP80745.1 hypothetical protein SAMN05216277_10910 [Halolamina pelagica]
MFDPTHISKNTDETASTIHHTLRASRRRYTIFLLIHYHPQLRVAPDQTEFSNGGTCSLSVRELAREIASLEEGISKDQATGEKYRNVYNSLIQTHLPKLAEVGALNYNSTSKTVKPDENLVALAMAASISCTVSELIFYSSIVDQSDHEEAILDGTIDD